MQCDQSMSAIRKKSAGSKSRRQVYLLPTLDKASGDFESVTRAEARKWEADEDALTLTLNS